MSPPSSLAVATQAVNRLVKEESYYHKELAGQEARVAKLEKDMVEKKPPVDTNAEFVLNQEKAAMRETKAVFEPLRKRITEAVQKLEEQIAIAESDGNAPDEELRNARQALQEAQKLSAV